MDCVKSGHLRHNVAALQALLPPGCRLMPVVKAAYGHGRCAHSPGPEPPGHPVLLRGHGGGGSGLRRHHIPGDILILGFTPVEELSLVRRYDLIQTVVDWDYARQLNRLGAPIRVHVAVDTGMHRLGSGGKIWNIWAIFSMEHLQVGDVHPPVCRRHRQSPRTVPSPQPRQGPLNWWSGNCMSRGSVP